MRAAVLLILAILFPAFAHASTPACSSFPPVVSPLLTVYTILNTTIYPTATVESGLATTTTIDICFSERVSASIEIESADGVIVNQLYSSSGVTNPEPKIWDGKDNKTTGKKGELVANGVYTINISASSTGDDNLIMSDSSRTITVASPSNSNSSDSDSTPSDDSSDATETTETAVSSSSSGPAEYLPIPTLRIIANGDRTVSSGADTAFTATVYDSKGNKRDDATVMWSFGDGMRKTGASVFHTYYDPGEYLAVVHVTTSDGGDVLKEMVITVKDASIKIASVSSRGITLSNNDSRTLDVSLWRLSMGGKDFKIPEDTQILAGRTVLFPSQVIELPIASSAFLLYPSGEVAAAYPAPVAKKLLAPNTSTNTVKVVEPIISQKTPVQKNENAVSAPAVATEVAAAGAALTPASSAVTSSGKSSVTGIFHSPWTLGLLGVIVLAGGAFILL